MAEQVSSLLLLSSSLCPLQSWGGKWTQITLQESVHLLLSSSPSLFYQPLLSSSSPSLPLLSFSPLSSTSPSPPPPPPALLPSLLYQPLPSSSPLPSTSPSPPPPPLSSSFMQESIQLYTAHQLGCKTAPGLFMMVLHLIIFMMLSSGPVPSPPSQEFEHITIYDFARKVHFQQAFFLIFQLTGSRTHHGIVDY